MTDVDETAENLAIRDLISTYCRGVDRLDLELVRSCYHAGAECHHAGFDGVIEDYLPWLEKGLRRFVGTLHLAANQLVEFVGDRALSETYGVAVHWGDAIEPADLNYSSGFRYVDVLEKRGGKWGIIERHGVREFLLVNSPLVPTSSAPTASRDASDTYQVVRRRLMDTESGRTEA